MTFAIEVSTRAINANTDWRDVLVAAGFANEVLAHRRWFEEGLL
jgi:hypothetical protein